MAVLFPSFVHELLVFLTKALWNMAKKLCHLYYMPNKTFLSTDGEILYRSSQDTYQQRKKTQLFVNHWHMELRNKKFSSEDSDLCTHHHKTHAKGKKGMLLANIDMMQLLANRWHSLDPVPVFGSKNPNPVSKCCEF
jgi:hypothetical protein